MCECLDKIKNGVAKEFDAYDVNIEGVIPFNMKVGFLPVINIFYKTKKKNGELTKKEHKIYAAASFCPFCGKKYEE